MTTIVYQGLQSCFESQIIEKTTLKLKVPTPSSIEFGRAPCMIATPTNFDNNIENLKEKCHSPNNNYHQVSNNNYHQVTNKPCSTTTTTTNLQDFGGWTSLQTLSNISKEESTYVHPLSKQKSSYSRLSERSLALCTESLGSETGSDNYISMESSNIFSFSSSSTIEKSPLCSTPTTSVDQEMTHQAESSSTWSRKCNKVIRSSTKNSCHKFPPPLTTIRGLNSVQFRPHREDGRLIIKAVEAPLTHNYLQAERSNGRLRLCLFKDGFNSSASNFDSNMTLDENEELDVIENDILESETNEEEEMECEEEEEEQSDMYNVKWDIDGNKFDVEGEMGMEKCQRFSRCKEGGGQSNKVFCDWRNNKPLWVATS